MICLWIEDGQPLWPFESLGLSTSYAQIRQILLRLASGQLQAPKFSCNVATTCLVPIPWANAALDPGDRGGHLFFDASQIDRGEAQPLADRSWVSHSRRLHELLSC